MGKVYTDTLFAVFGDTAVEIDVPAGERWCVRQFTSYFRTQGVSYGWWIEGLGFGGILFNVGAPDAGYTPFVSSPDLRIVLKEGLHYIVYQNANADIYAHGYRLTLP